MPTRRCRPRSGKGSFRRNIALRSELNEAEQIGIAKAERWAFGRRRDVAGTLFLQTLHKRMFGDVWRWAGTFRTSPRNIGIDAYRIATELRQLIADARLQMSNGTYPPDEIAVRLHHRLVFIHAFPNGNGATCSSCGRPAGGATGAAPAVVGKRKSDRRR